MIENTNIDLEKLQQTQFEIALWIKDVCQKNNIKYFLIAGTLLGAIRHKDFIPWDDDFDIGMLRSDYDLFIKVAQKEANNNYFIQTLTTDKNMPLSYTKVRLNGSALIEENSENCKWNAGIFVDLFPFDGVPDSLYLRLIHEYASKIITVMLLYKCNFKLKNNKIFTKLIISPLASVVPIFLLKKISSYIITMYSKRKTTYVIASGGSYGYKKEIIPLKWVEKQSVVLFRDVEFCCPVLFHEYLVNLYGDYMTPPSPEQRHNRHGIKLIKYAEM